MSNTTKKLTAGLLMVVTTVTAGSTCFANQVGFFYDGTGCKTAQCYEDLWREMDEAMGCLNAKINLEKFALEDDLVKKYYPNIFEKIDYAQKSIIECADDECVMQSFEEIAAAVRQYKVVTEDYLNNLNDENRSELAERGLANKAIYFKSCSPTIWELLRKNENFAYDHRVKFWNAFIYYELKIGLDSCKTEDFGEYLYRTEDFAGYIESSKAIYD